MRVARLSAALVVFVAAAGARTAPSPRPQQKPAAAQQPAVSDKAIKTQTRLITVDVVVTDSHGNAVRGLKQDDFQILEARGQQQRIARFAFVDRAAGPAPVPGAQPAGAPHVYSNIQATPMRVAPTAILMDALNTSTLHQMQVRRDMILFLKSLPTDTPVAVLLLGHSVHIVQNFTTDPKLLHAAVDQSMRPTTIEKNPEDDSGNISNTLRETGATVPESVLKSIEDFEREQYMEQMQDRVEETAAAMRAIAKFLGGYPGRKNLIWFSDSFPIWIEPSADFGGNPFAGSNSFEAKVREAAEALTGARIAVYPVDARGLEGPLAFSASNANTSTPQHPGGDIGGALGRENTLRIQSQATMEEVANETGGRVCKNTNDLAGCVQQALNESSAYYELAYYPDNVKWDGRFHKITVKLEQKGVKLAYRRGYFATDAQEAVKHAQPLKLLQEACRDPLPSTSIPITAQAVPPREVAPGQAAAARYLLTIPASAVNIAMAGGSRSVNLEVAICEFSPKGDAFQIHRQDLSRTVPAAIYESWQANGIRNIFNYDAKPENQRLRFAALDLVTGATGALDVPAHPHEFGSVPGPIAAPMGAAPAAKAASESAPAAAGTSERQMPTSLTFRSSSGKASTLDWNKGTVSYTGDLGFDMGAEAFFQKFFGASFHCRSGSLVPNDTASSEVPKRTFMLRSLAGPVATIDLNGSEPQYSGDLPVDSQAKQFFEQLWKLCHCRKP